MAPTGLSLNALARHLGRAKSGLSKLATAGRIPKNADGTFDPDAVAAALRSNTDPARRRVHSERKPVNGEQRTPVPPVTTEDDAKQAISLIRRVLESEGAASDGTVDFDMARTAETILKARERDLKIAERRKELVPLVKVKQHVEKAFIGYRQAVQRLPTRHAAAIAAEIGCNAADLDRLLSEAINAELTALSAPVVRP